MFCLVATIGKRFESIGLPNTEDNRRKYRELLFTSGNSLSNNISGVILFDETFRQSTADGKPFVKVNFLFLKYLSEIRSHAIECEQSYSTNLDI